MIKSSKIYNELSIYTENKIILWGGGFFGRQYLEKLRWFEINVVAFCDNNSKIHGSKIDGVPVISPDELRKMLEENNDIVVQIACEIDEEVLLRQLRNLGVLNYISKKHMEHNIKYFKKYSDIDFDVKFPGNSDGNHIRLTKIDSEFSIYKNNKVILWGAGKFGRQMLDLFRYHKLEVEAFCDNNEELHGTEVSGVKVISPDELKNMVDDGEDIVVQIAYGSVDYSDLYKQFELNSIENYINYEEAFNVLEYIKKCYVLYSNPNLFDIFNGNDHRISVPSQFNNYMVFNDNDYAVLICMPGKTGDETLNRTFGIHNIPSFNTWHSIELIKKNNIKEVCSKKIKMITAVREPLSMTLSGIYEGLSKIGNITYILNGNRILFPFEKSALLKNYGDVQYIFDIYTKEGDTKVENYINLFCEQVIDIKKVPFDKEKGYTIVKDGNIEVFVYQLEKMNDIVKEMAEFVGGNFTEWEMGNVASDKWIANSYKQAQKEIKISQEYFDKCFSESYVNHFYSEEDIEKFKARWRPHIRENN